MNPLIEKIRIGTLLRGNSRCMSYVKYASVLGFESFQIHFWEHLGETDLSSLAEDVREQLKDKDITISSLGIYGNPLKEDEMGVLTRKAWFSLIDAALLFGTDLICGFTGRIPGKSVPESTEQLARIFCPICEYAEKKKIRIAFENCSMGGNWQTGDWNMAIGPDAWELIFRTLPYEHIGLEWEPGHSVLQLADPLVQIEPWLQKIFHVHGKDGSVNKDILNKQGFSGKEPYAEFRLPGFGDTDWKRIIDRLLRSGYKGTLDIEGYHDPVFRKELEWTGQVNSLNYLKLCRGGSFVQNL